MLAKEEYAKFDVVVKCGSTMVKITVLKVICLPLSLIQTVEYSVTITILAGTVNAPVLHLNWPGRVLRNVNTQRGPSF